MKGRYNIRNNKENGLYNVFFNESVPMYCGTFDTKEKAQEFIKGSREYGNKLKRAENRKEKDMIKNIFL